MSNLHRMDAKQLSDFVREYIDHRIFTSAMIRNDDKWQEMVPMVFLPLLFGAFDKFSDDEFKDIGVVWAYYSEALPRGINGYPCFMKCRIMHANDWFNACRIIDHLKNEQEKIIRREYGADLDEAEAAVIDFMKEGEKGDNGE